MIQHIRVQTGGKGLYEITDRVQELVRGSGLSEGGPDDMPSHIRAALTATTLSIPFEDGALCLGTWQGIYLWEHRRRGSARRCVVHTGA